MSDAHLKIHLFDEESITRESDLLVIGIYQGGEAQSALARCPDGVAREVRRALKAGWLRGEAGEIFYLPVAAGEGLAVERLLLVGLGKRESVTLESLRVLGATVVKACEKSSVDRAMVLVSLDEQHGIAPAKVMAAMAEGAWLGSYRFERYQGVSRKDAPRHRLKRLDFLVPAARIKGAYKRLEQVVKITRGVFLARDLCNTPGNHLTPDGLAKRAREMAERLPIKTTIFSSQVLAQKGMHGILAVGQGSEHPPCMIIMEYRKGGDRPTLAVVGKAITFDSGGISLKPGAKMEEMKFDMSGGAAVFGFMHAIAEMALPINVVGIVPSAENMPSGTAQRPGDVIKTARGIHVEVINTDAEGRLILAEALHHAATFDPDVIIDLATLTGACVVALGSHATGLMGNHAGLQKRLRKAGERCGERLWSLPMFPEYQEQIKSVVADIKNVGGREAGTITAACFLSRFVDESRAWAHLDIAGTAYDLSSSKPHMPKGAVGIGVRLLCAYVLTERV
ncbi:MAG: leucyl aminopeptidase [Magnetococcales bacterium]|nr:leucyl aminopeptidase [Magnetococcales bacterium]